MTRQNRILASLTIVLSGILIFMHGYLTSYTRLLADDFCSAYYAERFGLLRSIWFWRLNWSGRYSAFAADWVFARIFGVYSLHILIPVLILVWLIFTILAVNLHFQKIAPEKNNLSASLLAGTVFLFTVLTLSPDLPQSLYWWNGMRSYALPIISLTLGFCVFQLWVGKLLARNLLFWGGVTSFVLVFISGGFSETFAVLQFILLLFLILLRLMSSSGRKNDATLLVLLSGLAGAATSLIVIISAPGNLIRQAQLPPHPDLAGLITISVHGYLYSISRIFSSAEQWMGFLGMLAVFTWLGRYYKDQVEVENWRIPVYILLGILLSFACIPPGVFGYSEPPPPRTMIIPFFVLVFFWGLACFLSGAVLANIKKRVFDSITRGALVLGVLLVGFSSLAQVRSLYQQRDVYKAYAESWDRIDAQILAAKSNGETSVKVPVTENWAGLNILNENPKFWVNACYSQYYGISVLGPALDPAYP